MSDAWVSPERTSSVRRAGGVLIVVNGGRPVSDSDWGPIVTRLVDELRTRLPDGLLMVSPTQMISNAQRATLIDALERAGIGHVPRVALVTRSLALRAGVTFIRWFLRARTDVRAFAPGLERNALAWLGERTPLDVDEALRLARADLEALGDKAM